MIATTIFNQRREICSQCAQWKGVCLKGHALASAPGCPEKRFAPEADAGYMPDQPAVQLVAGKPCCSGKNDAPEAQALSYPAAAQALAASLTDWVAAGFPLTTDAEYRARLAICERCAHFKGYRCQLCHCFMYAKARLRTAECLAGSWPRL